jgi:hypothetical protein
MIPPFISRSSRVAVWSVEDIAAADSENAEIIIIYIWFINVYIF